MLELDCADAINVESHLAMADGDFADVLIKETRITQMAAEAQQINGVRDDLAKVVEGMLAAHEFGLAVHWIRTEIERPEA